jgi:hypothetical protein
MKVGAEIHPSSCQRLPISLLHSPPCCDREADGFQEYGIEMRWLGRQGSNLRMTGSKPVALPLGYAPTRRAANISEHPVWMQRQNVTRIVILVYNPDMVDPSMPWSLKNISDEAREFAKLSADKSDVPVGAWLSQVIRAGSPGSDRDRQPPAGNCPRAACPEYCARPKTCSCSKGCTWWQHNRPLGADRGRLWFRAGRPHGRVNGPAYRRRHSPLSEICRHG